MAELLGDRIRKARERYGMSQAELARRIHVSKQTMYQIESNKTPDPGALKVRAIAEVLGISNDFLLTGKEAARRQNRLEEDGESEAVFAGAGV